MKLEKQQPTRSRWRIGPRWVELLVVSVLTIATGYFTGRVSEKNYQADSPQPTATVTVRATETVTATPDATPTSPLAGAGESENGSVDGENPEPTDGSSVRPAQSFLSDLNAVTYTGYYDPSPVLMLGTNHPNSVRLGCDSSSSDSVTYDVSSYKRLKATLGIPSDADNAIGSVAAIKVFDSSGRQIADAVQFRSSDTADLSVDITGQDQIRITCALVKSGDPNRSATTSGLGDAVLTS
ncbi:NPCBM/NEW2 domain-containing protein [Streptomyces sp. WI04-05B]|uniref:NPCBM/NEW2 domain-containing protein n=1 Tax=Streptomyces TaxID=1883 RepID=UPI0029A301D6|nr:MULTISPECIES: NPCBM/NEW2 domain-containing protein [unclassified Streptomyces]MDX2547003.1 NPCBM/NEW2 domain-containing protein [Streptomyces sp. WI04-05B]MDX2589692.1 NPCBM/NEW2 domain-containing protein [Streptomyces sp. WI04-05A]MDX3753142.1 NPCBM/NEW2 domain-containing protein [Streptomyces sp. AK08-02]